MNKSDALILVRKAIHDMRYSSKLMLDYHSQLANLAYVRRQHLNRMFDLQNEIRPDIEDLLTEDLRQELINLEEELLKWQEKRRY